MYSSRLRARGSAASLAILQAILLISALVLGPAAAIAQDDAAAAPESAPQQVLLIQPEPVKLTVGESRVVTAWVCPPGTAGPLNADADPDRPRMRADGGRVDPQRAGRGRGQPRQGRGRAHEDHSQCPHR